jgi:lysophospholipase L1-like esterase
MRHVFSLIFAAMLLYAGGGRIALAQQTAATELRVEWEVKNRFRLFRNEADFQRHIDADRGDGVMAAEARLEAASDGRGWAAGMLNHLCVDPSGKLTETCTRDGEPENYLAPHDHRVGVTLAGPVPPGASCTWNFDDGSVPVQQATVRCDEEVRLRLLYGKPTIASVGITAPDGSIQQATTEIAVRDVLIAGLGDSVAAGEGNPDLPVALADTGFCFRGFSGTASSFYFRPAREGYVGNHTCESGSVGAGASASADTETQGWYKRSARWMSAACHRSLYSYQTRAALSLAVADPHLAVTYIPLACSGAAIDAGLLNSQRARECPTTNRACSSSVAGQLTQLRDLLKLAQRIQPERRLDLMLLTIGANDIRFSGLVANTIVEEGVERVLFNRAGLLTSPSEAQKLLDTQLATSFTTLRGALAPLLGGDLSRVIYVTYAHPALLDANTPCPGGRDGFDVHPVFSAEPTRLRRASDFVSGQFLPKLKALAQSTRMTLVDAHQAAFATHGFCAHSSSDPVFDQECFSPSGESFERDPIRAITHPLACNLQPSEFRPYASRARWIRTANDSYFAAMTYPSGLSSLLQPADIHDALWGVLSAVYGGAMHPTAEGHAAMADAALPAMRGLLGVQQPAAVTAQPLPPPGELLKVQ